MISFVNPSALLSAVLLLPGTVNLASAIVDPFPTPYPSHVHLKTAVLTNTVPLAYYDANYTAEDETELFPAYRGFQPDLLRELVNIAKYHDNVTLTWELEEAPAFSYTTQFEFMANDCIGSVNKKTNETRTEEMCNRLDLVIGDYYGYPSRSIRTIFTPPLLTTAASSIQYVNRQQRQITTLGEAQALQEPVCLLDRSHYDDQAIERFPGLVVERCYNHTQCIDWLKLEKCAVFVEDELQLRYLMVQDADLQVTPEKFDEQYIVWPLNARLEPLKQQLIIRWIYQAKVSGYLDQLYEKYFQINFCKLGLAGVNCDKPCSTSHGSSDRYGTCVCESTRWTGDDCSIEVQENMNLLPTSLKALCYLMIAINYFTVLVCGIWLFFFRDASAVKVAQPLFLGLVLMGCLLSTSTIFALVQEDDGSNGHGQADVPACMAIPWLYSVGFCITFGSLLSKILRVYRLFRAAETMQRVAVTTRDTIKIIAGVLMVDVILLLAWTFADPLEWERQSLSEDKFGNPLSSEGYCVSDNWAIFGGLIAVYHLLLMAVACYMCYCARDIPTEFSEGKYVTIAMISNLQIFVVAVPVLIILGSDSQTSIFVRSVIIWMNDFVVVTLIFGNLFNIVHLENRLQDNSKQLIREAMNTYKERKERRESSMLEANSNHSRLSSFASSLNDSNHSSKRGSSIMSNRPSFMAGNSVLQRASLFGNSHHRDADQREPAPRTSVTMNSSVMENSNQDVNGLSNSNRSASSQRRLALVTNNSAEPAIEPIAVKRHSDPYMDTLAEVSARMEDSTRRSVDGSNRSMSLRASGREEDKDARQSVQNLATIVDQHEDSSIGALEMSESEVEFGGDSGVDLNHSANGDEEAAAVDPLMGSSSKGDKSGTQSTVHEDSAADLLCKMDPPASEGNAEEAFVPPSVTQ